MAFVYLENANTIVNTKRITHIHLLHKEATVHANLYFSNAPDADSVSLSENDYDKLITYLEIDKYE